MDRLIARAYSLFVWIFLNSETSDFEGGSLIDPKEQAYQKNSRVLCFCFETEA